MRGDDSAPVRRSTKVLTAERDAPERKVEADVGCVYEQSLHFQIWSGGGRLLYQSTPDLLRDRFPGAVASPRPVDPGSLPSRGLDPPPRGSDRPGACEGPVRPRLDAPQ